jgi:hypothetical protein
MARRVGNVERTIADAFGPWLGGGTAKSKTPELLRTSVLRDSVIPQPYAISADTAPSSTERN